MREQAIDAVLNVVRDATSHRAAHTAQSVAIPGDATAVAVREHAIDAASSEFAMRQLAGLYVPVEVS